MDPIRMPLNYMKTAVLLAVLTAVFVGLGYMIGGPIGMVIAFVVALGMNVFSFWNSDKMVLRMHGAQAVDAQSAPDYYKLVRELADNAGLPMPGVYVMHNPQPNAFATGRSPEHAAVCASTGLLEMLDYDEIAGVMAHELAHIKNRDTLTMTVAATIAGAISMLAQYLQFSMLFGRRDNNVGWIGALAAMIIAPLAAGLVQVAISRSREYQADRMGAEICRNPLGLASALRKIESYARRIPNETAEQAPGSAHMFIINPLTGRGMDSLFSTHPKTANRIAELQAYADELGVRADTSGRRRTGHVRGAGPWDDDATDGVQGVQGPWGNRTADASRKRGPWG